MGIKARKMAEGRWVKTMVFTLPMRLAREEAMSMESAAMTLVVKKMLPSVPSETENFVLMNQVTHDLSFG